MRNETDYVALLKKMHKALRKIAIRERSSEGRGFCYCCRTSWKTIEKHTEICPANWGLIDDTKKLFRARWTKQQQEYRKRKKDMLQNSQLHSPENILLHFVREREDVRLKKESGLPAPWTDDPVLNIYRFCNVHRRDDRVTRWLLQNYYIVTNGNSGFPVDTWFWAAVARLINWPPTLRELMLRQGVIPYKVEKYDPVRFAAELEKVHKKNPAKTYTGAYMLYAGGRAKNNSMVKSDFIAHHLLHGLVANKDTIREAISGKTIRGTVDALRQSHGISTFMAGQIAADLSYLPELKDATDLYSYAPQGPGSIRGLNRLTGKIGQKFLRKRKPTEKTSPGDGLSRPWEEAAWNEELIKLNEKIKSETGIPDLTLHDLQNCLCEYDKYMRTINGEGRPRSFYRPETAY